MSKYISVADTAKLVRQALKEAFPGVKFGVRSKSYSGGASINVHWTDGPNTQQVDAIIGPFEGAYFDSMTDYKGYKKTVYNGEEVHFGADYIFSNRHLSDEVRQRCIDVACKLAGYPPVTIEEYNRNHWNTHGDSPINHLAAKRMKKISDRFTQPSPTVAEVICTEARA